MPHSILQILKMYAFICQPYLIHIVQIQVILVKTVYDLNNLKDTVKKKIYIKAC